MISRQTMRCRKARRLLRYHMPNKHLSLENFAHHVLLLFNPFGYEKMQSGCPPLYKNEVPVALQTRLFSLSNISK